MVAGLLGVAEDAAHEREEQHTDERRLERDGRCEAEQVKHGKAAEDRVLAVVADNFRALFSVILL